MKKCTLERFRLNLTAAFLLASPLLVQAQYFNIADNGDLVAGFRKTGVNQGSNELVVSCGNATNLLNLSAGATLTMSNVDASILTDAFSADFTHIQWSVFGANFSAKFPWITPLGNFPQSTLWYTIPRASASTKSAPPPRAYLNFQSETASSILSISAGANYIGSILPGGTNADNNTNVVVEPVQSAYNGYLLTSFMGDPNDSTLGDLGGQAFTYSIELTNPAPFAASVRSDLYQLAPKAFGTNQYVDPISGSATNVYWVGYFDFSPAGVITFTRATTNSTPPPPAPTLSASHSGNTVTISFGTTNGATYTLIYTNLSGLTAPRSNWFTLGSPIIGTGGVANFTDTVTTSGRVYSVTAH